MSYRVLIPKSVQKELDRLPQSVQERIDTRLTDLKSNPRPHDVKKLKGRSGWRIRAGDYRIIYEIHDKDLFILVITIGHRREVYD